MSPEGTIAERLEALAEAPASSTVGARVVVFGVMLLIAAAGAAPILTRIF